MDEKGYKEVYFDQYCPSCKYFSMDETEGPCSECMCYPINLYSHRPVEWKEKD